MYNAACEYIVNKATTKCVDMFIHIEENVHSASHGRFKIKYGA